jgi:predicted MPP superfamily phosphohydrolase
LRKQSATPGKRLSRRKWLRRALAGGLAITGGVLFDTFYIEPHWVEFVYRDLPIRHLPSEWDGKRLVQISDIHVGPQVSDSYLIETFQQVAKLNPDIVVVTGDFVTLQRHMHSGLLKQVELVYSQLPKGVVATVGILGNHDYGSRWTNAELAAQVGARLKDCGLVLLRNQSLDLGGFAIAGLDDLWSGGCDCQAALAGTFRDSARLVLCHNPDAADQVNWNGFEGWILSGHTHGGQCKPPFLDPPLLPVSNTRYTSGEFALAGNRTMYINRGLGHLFPVRFNCRPEITVFRLVTS